MFDPKLGVGKQGPLKELSGLMLCNSQTPMATHGLV